MKRSLLRLVARMQARRRRAAETACLKDLNDHLLADIGLRRDGIATAVARASAFPDWWHQN
ncbi:DUF1127 domain-containing protein [Chelativorans alearense]|uniref:DUF1127 domain-containing protein n=1 Tax=Chelativorans alearense TaxID=2681495 RepID=UPI0013D401F6|nr:DUF1127 domain-containing protein [Chelativorans alearense]